MTTGFRSSRSHRRSATSGNVDGAVLLLRDARAERARADTNRTVRAVVDASPDALIGIDAARRIVSWNPAAKRMFGYGEKDVLGRDVALLVAARWLRRHPLDEAFRDTRSAVGPIDLLCVGFDGERFRATAAACPVPGGMRERVALAISVRLAGDQRRRDRRAQRTLRGARDARRQADTSNRLRTNCSRWSRTSCARRST